MRRCRWSGRNRYLQPLVDDAMSISCDIHMKSSSSAVATALSFNCFSLHHSSTDGSHLLSFSSHSYWSFKRCYQNYHSGVIISFIVNSASNNEYIFITLVSISAASFQKYFIEKLFGNFLEFQIFTVRCC